MSKEVRIFLTFCLSRMSSDFDSSDSRIHLATVDVLFPIQSIDNAISSSSHHNFQPAGDTNFLLTWGEILWMNSPDSKTSRTLSSRLLLGFVFSVSTISCSTNSFSVSKCSSGFWTWFSGVLGLTSISGMRILARNYWIMQKAPNNVYTLYVIV